MATRIPAPPDATLIYLRPGQHDHLVGYLDAEGAIFRLRWETGVPIGRVTADRHVFRTTQHDEREVGLFTPEGTVRSHGLFEGGTLGWVESDGVVMQGGLILGEEEVGRVEGPQIAAAAAALLLIFQPDEQEAARRSERQA